MAYIYMYLLVYVGSAIIVVLMLFSRLLCICEVPFSLENCGSHDCGADVWFDFITFSNVFCLSSVLLGVLSTHDHGFHGFWGYIAYSLLRARAGGSLAVPLCVVQLCEFQGKHRVVLLVSLGMSLGIMFRSTYSGILGGVGSREYIANWRCAHMHVIWLWFSHSVSLLYLFIHLSIHAVCVGLTQSRELIISPAGTRGPLPWECVVRRDSEQLLPNSSCSGQ